MPKKKSDGVDTDRIQESVDSIRENANAIEEEIEDKSATTHGDPVVDIY